MKKLVKTTVGQRAEMRGTSGIALNYDTSTTLNTKYGIAASKIPTTKPEARYIGIGIGGKYNVDGEDLSAPYTPNPLNMDLVKPIPIRAVPLANDLSSVERLQYRMRRVMRIGDLDVVFYYLKCVTPIDDEVQVTVTDPTTNQETPYVFDPQNLTNPKYHKPQTSGSTNTLTSSINVTVSSTITIYGSEVLEAINMIYGGDLNRASISEVGLYFGSDFQHSATDKNGQPFNYTEAALVELGFIGTSTGTDMSSSDSTYGQTMRQGNNSVVLL